MSDSSLHGDPPLRLAYRWGSAAVEAAVPRPLGPVARAFFPDTVGEPGGRPADLELSAAHGATPERRPGRGHGWRVRSEGRESGWQDLPSALVAYELALAELLVRRSPDAVPVHAAGVRVAGGGLLLAGGGGHGKSTLAAAAARAGSAVYGDDVVLLDPRGRAAAFPRLLKLVPPAPALVGAPAPAPPLADLWPDASLHHPVELGGAWADPAPVCAVLFLERDGARRDVTLAPMGPGRAVRRLLPHLQLVAAAGPREFEAVAAAVDGAEAAVLRYGDARRAVDWLLDRWG